MKVSKLFLVVLTAFGLTASFGVEAKRKKVCRNGVCSRQVVQQPVQQSVHRCSKECTVDNCPIKKQKVAQAAARAVSGCASGNCPRR